MTYHVTMTIGEVSQSLALEIDMRLTAALHDSDQPNDATPLNVLVRDEAGRLIGTLSGTTSYGWLLIKQLWVAEGVRGVGLGEQMLTAAETEAVARGCHHARLDTSHPRAERFYKHHGYTPFATLENEVGDEPVGHRRVFLSKALFDDMMKGDGLPS